MTSFERVADMLGIRLRPQQRAVLRHMTSLDSAKRFFVIPAPTGTGKSILALVYALLKGSKAYFVVPTRHLQRQYNADFQRFDLFARFGVRYAIIWGRQHFTCPFFTERFNKETPASLCPYITGDFWVKCPYRPRRVFTSTYDLPKDADKAYTARTYSGWLYFTTAQVEDGLICDYWDAKIQALRNDFVVMNYAYYLRDFLGISDFPPPRVLVFDEVHVIFDIIRNHFTFTLPGNVYSAPVSGSLVSVLSAFSRYYESRAYEAFEKKHFRAFVYYTRVLQQVTFALNHARSFRIRTILRGGRIKYFLVVPDPVSLFVSLLRSIIDTHMTTYGEPPYILLMSATPGAKSLWDRIFASTGYSSYYEYIPELPSPFPVENRLVFLLADPSARINYENEVDPDVVQPFASMVLDAYRHLESLGKPPNILVHAYKLSVASAIYDTLVDLAENFGVDPGAISIATSAQRTHGEELLEEIELFKQYGGVLVTTAANQGVDLPYDTCRLQFIYRAPYPNAYQYPRPLYSYYVAKTLVQQAGRVVRAADDWGFTVVYDRNVSTFISRNQGQFPKYFLEAIVYDSTWSDVKREVEKRVRHEG